MHWTVAVFISTALFPVAYYFAVRGHVGATVIPVLTSLLTNAAVVFHVAYVMPKLRSTIVTHLAAHANIRNFQQVVRSPFFSGRTRAGRQFALCVLQSPARHNGS